MTTSESAPFLDLVARRYSCRAYDPARSVSDEALRECLEAARLAPSACNRQPWRFVAVRDAERRRAICEGGLLPGIGHAWLADAPVIVVLCVDIELVTHRLAPALSGVQYHLVDAGIAGEHFVLAAAERGLGTCWIGWFKQRAVRRIIEAPRRVRVVSLIALGYPAAAPEPPFRAGRKDLGEIAFADEWGKAVRGRSGE